MTYVEMTNFPNYFLGEDGFLYRKVNGRFRPIRIKMGRHNKGRFYHDITKKGITYRLISGEISPESKGEII
jgi:hypothetical protein